MAKKLRGLDTPIYNDLGQRYMPGGWWGDWADRTQQAVEDQSRLIMGQDPRNYPWNQPYSLEPAGDQPIYRSISTSIEPNAISLIKKYFPPSQWITAFAVMMGESSGQNIPSEFNKRGTENSHGLFQINLDAHPEMATKVYDPEENVKFAAKLQKQFGWQPWGAYTDNRYKQYLTEAKQVMGAPQQGGFGGQVNKFMAALIPTAYASEEEKDFRTYGKDLGPSYATTLTPEEIGGGTWEGFKQRFGQPGEFPSTQSYFPRSSEVMSGYPKYTVKKGDTLWDIAEKNLGSGFKWKELLGYTGDPRKMPIGTKITIPPITGIQAGTQGIPRVEPSPVARYAAPNTVGGYQVPVSAQTLPQPTQKFVPFKGVTPMPTQTFILSNKNPIARYFQPNTLGGFKY